MTQQFTKLHLDIPQESAHAATTMATEAGFEDLGTYLLFRVEADLKTWRYHLDNGEGIPVCPDREGRPAPIDVFRAFPKEKTCPDCRTLSENR